MRRWQEFLAFTLLLASCQSETILEPNTSCPNPAHCPEATDGGTRTDASKPDIDVPKPDAGKPDSGFDDPSTVFEDLVDLHGLLTYVKMTGTLTSTLPPVLFLHGGPAISHEYFLPHMKVVEPGRLLVFYDMRATGQTSFGTINTSTITLAQHVDDVADVLEFVRGHIHAEKFDLLGHDYGAAVAALYAADHPEDVRQLILTTPFPAKNDYLIDRESEASRRLTSPDLDRMMRIRNRPMCYQDISACYLEIWNIIGPKRMCESKRDHWGELTFLYGSYRAEMFVRQALIEAQYDLTNDLRRIRVPTTVIGGECDIVPKASADTYAREIPGAVYVSLPESGAFPFVESPETYQALLLSTLNGRNPR